LSRHYLFVIWEGGGTVPPELALAHKLCARGYRITVLAEPPAQAEIESIGTQYLRYTRAPFRQVRKDHLRDWTTTNQLKIVKNLLDKVLVGRRESKHLTYRAGTAGRSGGRWILVWCHDRRREVRLAGCYAQS
jgi:hypothetical protein